jgi:methionyl-tRNA formyltransferase
LARNVRAFNPWPVAFFALAQADSTQHIKVWEAHVEPSTKTVAAGTILAADKHGLIVQTGQDALRITRCQLPNKKAMAFADVINARADWFSVGTCL